MGGPWKAREFDATAWRPPVPQVVVHAARTESAEQIARDRLTWIAVGYVASVVTSFAITVFLLKLGW